MNRETEMQNEIFKLSAPGGKFRVLGINEAGIRILKGDVLIQRKDTDARGGLAGWLVAILRPGSLGMTPQDAFNEARRLDVSNGGRFNLFASGVPVELGDLTFSIWSHRAYSENPIAILKRKEN